MNLSTEFMYQIFEKEFITKYDSSIKKQLKVIANNICYDTIPQRYIDNSIKKYEYGYVYRDTRNNNKIIAFVLWSIIKSPETSLNELHIHIICGKGLGMLMFNDIEEYAIQSKINTITLVPSNDKVKAHYIDSYGFKLRGYDKKIDGIIYYKNININYNFIIGKNKKIKRNKKHTIKHVYNKNKQNIKRHTLKQKQYKNNINNFINASKPKKIINLNNN
jgi:hypothetical protein